MNKKQKGFTLIELLVVIAIIGILAALVLVALGNARNKANDARIKSNIGQLRTLGEVHYDGNSADYTGFDTCVDGTSGDCEGGIAASVAALVSDIAVAGDGALNANASATAFCVSTTLKSDTDRFVCADSTGAFKESTTATCDTAAVACPD